jgi:hypothetical protein
MYGIRVRGSMIGLQRARNALIGCAAAGLGLWVMYPAGFAALPG